MLEKGWALPLTPSDGQRCPKKYPVGQKKGSVLYNVHYTYMYHALQMKGRRESNINVWFSLCIPRNDSVISRTELYCSVSPFLNSYICEKFINFQDWSAYSVTGKYVDRSWEYINHSQTHECGNWV